MTTHPARPASAEVGGRRQRTLWDEGRQPAARVVPAAVAVVALATLLDVAALSGPGWLFGVVFVGVSLAAALAVRPADFFAVGVLPPLVMLAVFTVLALAAPASVAADDDGTVQALVSGLSRHSLPLGLGYGLCLAVLAVRDRFARGVVEPGDAAAVVRTGRDRLRRRAAPRAHPRTSPRPSWARRGSRRPR